MQRCDAEEFEDIKALIKVCIFLIPASMFSSMYGQKASTWVFQAKQMNGYVSWLGNVEIRPDQMQVSILGPGLFIYIHKFI